MKNAFLFIATIVISLISCSDNTISQVEPSISTQISSTDIVIGTKHTIYSKILEEEREILVHVPKQNSTDYDTMKYPVLYVLDGADHFQSVVALMNKLSTSFGDEICPEMIVVGINQIDRVKDLLPELSYSGILEKSNLINDKFTAFIEKEVQPFVDSAFLTAPYRTLIGYSLGGIKAMSIFTYHNYLFDAYIVIDPSLGSLDNQWFNISYEEIIQNDFSNKSLFLAMAQTMPMETDTIEIKKDTTSDSNHMRKIMSTANAIRQNNSNIDFTWKYYPNETHGSLPLIAEYDAFHEIYSWYNLQALKFIYKSDDSSIFVKEAISTHFKNVSQKVGYNYLPPESYLTTLVSYFYYNDKKDKAFALSELLIESYPKSVNAINTYQFLVNEKKHGFNKE
jgi:hypothetical protein